MYQITGAILEYRPIHLGHNSFIIQVAEFLCACQEWSNGRKLIKGLAARELPTSPFRVLKKPCGEVVAHRVPKDVLGSIFLSDISGILR